ncbi:rod-binding protein [Shewanella sp. AS16]|uniref:rod-binding protein n=1 Tax=Shewanella sp. AS16 TaxID=2907625 RepID=UPI001F2F3262|nr:rod-binding protein [Shewanella sp. AS16]MCE9686226.1 rod-binding protein [Shewanella sp. AS16]
MKLENNPGYLNQLNAGDLIKANGEQGALKLVSQQFEAQFLQTVLKQMRSASDAMADEDSPLSSKNDGLYRDLHDAELASRLSQIQTMGLSEVMTRQLSASLKSGADPVAFDPQQMTTTAMQPALRVPPLPKDAK